MHSDAAFSKEYFFLAVCKLRRKIVFICLLAFLVDFG